jgi:SWI/SNF-related matrix-associated actin-dependent regulator of chromatin subfamily A-like protein 1
MITARITKLDERHYGIASKYDSRLVDICHTLPGLKFNKSSKMWVGYGDSMRLLVDKLTKEKIAKTFGDPLPKFVSDLQVPDTATYKKIRDELKREYQVLGVHFIASLSKEGALLADATGLGKTKQALVAIREFLGYPTVIVCPAYLKSTWVSEGAKCGLDVFPLKGVKPPEDGKICAEDGIVVINYEIVWAWLEYLKGAKNIFFDECQALIGDKSRRSKVCKELSQDAENVVGLSATPFTNNTKQLHNVVDILSPWRFGGFFQFGLRHCNGHQKEIEFAGGETKKVYDFSGSSHLDELQERMKMFTLRRTKADVKLEIPSKTRQIIEIDIPDAAIDVSWETWSAEGMKTKTMRALNMTARAKIPSTVELSLQRMDEGSSVIVFCYQKNIAKELQKVFQEKGHDAFMATGDETVERRLKNAKAARAQTEGGSPSVLVATIDAMGNGVDLSYADITIFCELHYSPLLLVQCEGRSDRFGQKRTMTIYFMIGIGSIDEKIRDVILTKLENFEQVIGDMGDKFTGDLKGQSEEDSLAELREAIRAAAKEEEESVQA